MKADDLIIIKIDSIYKISTSTWARPFPTPRQTNGIVFFLDGEIRYIFGNKQVTAKKGDVLILPKDSVYSGVKQTADNSFYVVDFTVSDKTPFASFALPTLIKPKSFLDTEYAFRELLDCWNSTTLGANLRVKAKLYEIIYNLYKESNSEKEEVPGVLSRITLYINKNYMDPDLNIHEVGEHFQISDAQMRRLFVRYLQVSPIEYLQNIRIAHAKNMILDGLRIYDVASSCGYTNQFYFSRIFKQRTGYTPTEFRNYHQNI